MPRYKIWFAVEGQGVLELNAATEAEALALFEAGHWVQGEVLDLDTRTEHHVLDIEPAFEEDDEAVIQETLHDQ